MNPLDTLLPPAELPTGVAGEIDNIEAEIRRFQAGELQPERFRSFRLAWGIYGQRQPGVQMIRVKIPGGVLNGGQIARLAAISEEFSTGTSHLTTRQDVQFHYVQLERVGDLLRRLAEVGLTTREACGNSVRNVTACPLTGFIADELFDVAPYAQAVWAYLSRNPFCQQMARKFKIALSACPEDCASTAIHDIGFVGRVKDDGGPRLGFCVLVGGGLGTTPFVARVLDDFVPLDDILPVTRSILKVFAAEGNRRNKMKARLKYVVHRLGIETFRERVAEARRNLSFEERDEARLDLTLPDEYRALVERHRAGDGGTRRDSGGRTIPAGEGVPANGNGRVGPDRSFRSWLESSVRPHRDPTRAVVTVLTPLGDLTAPAFRAVARLATSYSGDEARIAATQNIVLPNVPRDRLRFLYDDLAAAGLAEAGVGTALDVTSCPGADTCSLGITSSKGLTREIRSEVTRLAGEIGLEAMRGVTIKVSGCPNACGQHHVANIGLHGVVKKVGGRSFPAYQVHIGGVIAHGGATIGRAADKVVARRVPLAVAALLRTWAARRRADESFVDYASRDPEEIAAALRPFVEPVPVGESDDRDWGSTEKFTTEEIGAGECAGAGLDAAVDPFGNFDAEVHQARLFMERRQWVDALANLNRSQYTLARVLLERIGRKPDSDYEVECELRARIIDRGLAGDGWNELHAAIGNQLHRRIPDPAGVTALLTRIDPLVDEFRGAFHQLEGRVAAGEPE